ncbi:membrane protein DedA with SNARE-associated domain [Arthrobacter pigmenti]|uniref:Membrane protein DedA with SNARE-associated domain n=2 Tax=Arthrobacter pigmenti TaxID=271432 RepID=A0A846RWQ7_9MICC|nr:membrane protein DedA with SNARE-associated domain [Arthrobacter pigmenti]
MIGGVLGAQNSGGGPSQGGLTGMISDVMTALGEIGVGFLVLLETVFPPIPSEVVLPLAGFLSQQGQMNAVLVFVIATIGSYAGALVLYFLGAKLGEERVVRGLSKLPLVDREDFERAAGWFHRHGRSAVFFGRLIPGVRSLISLPAGAEHMPLVTFSIFTAAGSAVWNALLIGLGYFLGTQYHLVDQYSQYFDIVLYGAIAALIIWLVVRRVRRRREA